MQLDLDFLDNQERTSRARRRLNLTLFALIACIIMLGDLAADAKPTEPICSVETVTPANLERQENPAPASLQTLY